MIYAKKLVVLPIDRYDDMKRKLQQLQESKETIHSESLPHPFNKESRGEEENTMDSKMPDTDESSQADSQSVLTSLSSVKVDSHDGSGRELDLESVAHTLGKPYRHKAKELLKHVKRSSPNHFAWDNKGMIVCKGKRIKGSNIIDLIRSVMYKKSKITSPVGLTEFLKILSKSNIPISLIGNSAIKERLQHVDKDEKPRIGVKRKHVVVGKRKSKWITL